MFPVSKENQLLKISDKDIDALEKYEKLLYLQNQSILLKVQVAGS